jgi:hypothetical protein
LFAAADFRGLIVGSGCASAPGAVSGKLAFTVEDAVAMSRDGDRVILCREVASVDDLQGFEV